MDKDSAISCKMCVLTSPLCRKMVSKLVEEGLNFCALLPLSDLLIFGLRVYSDKCRVLCDG